MARRCHLRVSAALLICTFPPIEGKSVGRFLAFFPRNLKAEHPTDSRRSGERLGYGVHEVEDESGPDGGSSAA